MNHLNQSEQINELASALAKAQAEIQPALKESVNPFFKSRYAGLSSVWSACKEALTKNGLAVIQTMDAASGHLMLLTTLVHSSGQWIRSSVPVNPTKNDPQALGSAITYMRRYSLAAIAGVTTDDDDGNCASQYAENSTNGCTTSITKPQADELENLLKQCDGDFAANVQKYISKLKVSSLQQLPITKYESLKTRIMARIAELEKEEAIA